MLFVARAQTVVVIASFAATRSASVEEPQLAELELYVTTLLCTSPECAVTVNVVGGSVEVGVTATTPAYPQRGPPPVRPLPPSEASQPHVTVAARGEPLSPQREPLLPLVEPSPHVESSPRVELPDRVLDTHIRSVSRSGNI